MLAVPDEDNLQHNFRTDAANSIKQGVLPNCSFMCVIASQRCVTIVAKKSRSTSLRYLVLSRPNEDEDDEEEEEVEAKEAEAVEDQVVANDGSNFLPLH